MTDPRPVVTMGNGASKVPVMLDGWPVGWLVTQPTRNLALILGAELDLIQLRALADFLDQLEEDEDA